MASAATTGDLDSSNVSWRSWYGLPVLLLIAHAVLAWIGRAPGIVTREDDARYFLLARALQAGTYQELWSPGLPAHHMYPPGYPGLLAVWMAIGGERFSWLIVLQIVLSLATLTLTFNAIRRWMPPVVVFSSAVTMAINPDLIRWAGEVASEGALAFCVALAIWAHACLPPGPRRTAIKFAAALAAPFFRAAGIVLLAALLAEWLWQRRSRAAFVAAAVFAAIIGPLLWWTLHDPSAVVGTSYSADLTFKGSSQLPLALVFVKRIYTNAQFYPMQALPWLIPLPSVQGSRIDNVIDAALVVTGLTIGMFSATKRLRLAVLILLASGGLVLIWPFQLQRFLLPFLPIIIVLFLFGFHALGARFHPRLGRALVVIMATIAVVVAIPRNDARIRELAHCDRGGSIPDQTCLSAEDRNFFRGLSVIADSLPQDAHVLAANAATMYLYTGRRGARALTIGMLDSARFWPRLQQTGLQYILLGALHASEPRLSRRLLERCTSLRLVSTISPHTYLFQVLSASETPRSDGGAMPGAENDSPACAALRKYREEARTGHWTLAARTGASARRLFAARQ